MLAFLAGVVVLLLLDRAALWQFGSLVAHYRDVPVATAVADLKANGTFASRKMALFPALATFTALVLWPERIWLFAVLGAVALAWYSARVYPAVTFEARRRS